MSYAVPEDSRWRLFPSDSVWVTEFQPPGHFWCVGPIHAERGYALALARGMGCNLSTIEVLSADPTKDAEKALGRPGDGA